ncbi:unnamed protein product [Clonostachys rosea f. rosea IK726]|uniref:Uncharacterized protein n=1 Tax=Clonostachys rosea f. rosea IK726 TaxID=1349383 RepID=A0ACA9UNN0_BIOOC|nr:unnamed protein product [Clonostachys rosea f. rosea IK726]
MATEDMDANMNGVAAETGAAPVSQVPSSRTGDDGDERAAKRQKVDSSGLTSETPAEKSVAEKDIQVEKKTNGSNSAPDDRDVRKGVAPVKKEYLIDMSNATLNEAPDDDLAEGAGHQRQDDRDSGNKGRKDKKQKNRGQNTERTFGHFDDAIRLCNSRAYYSEFSPRECRFGDRCRQSHDLRKYLAEGRREDVETFGGKCPIFEQHGRCSAGWKCRFVKSHMREVEHEDGRKELVLIDNVTKQDSNGSEEAKGSEDVEDRRADVFNIVPMQNKIDLNRKRVDFSRSEKYIEWLNKETKANDKLFQATKDKTPEEMAELRAAFVDPPFKPSEKRRIYFGPETPTLAPLTTQGNLPFRRLCIDLGAQLTYSEMAMGMPLIQGTKADWALLKAHKSELAPPKYTPGKSYVVEKYDNAKDLRFGAQISASVPWVAVKSADALSRWCPHLRLIDLNCGCPIDMVFKSGGGSALLDNAGKLERMIRGMNAVSGEVPITAKIRTGVRNNRPTANQVISRLAFGGSEHRERLGAPGCAAITLHGRSREQRYTKKADWGFIGQCSALIRSYNEEKDDLTDTAAEPDPSTLANTKDGRVYFLGNGDCFSHEDYRDHIQNAGVDSVMIGRGALIKPWLFEEIEKGQYLDKSATERLTYIEKFVRYGLEAWGSDELGIGFTRRFLLEWLSFTHRYVPIGLLEHLPPSLNDRPPAYKGRNELETLMASNNYKDWIKISEMFLGPVHPGFNFQPKHKSNAYEAEG